MAKKMKQVFRIRKAGVLVDNVSSGEVFAAIDAANGLICSDRCYGFGGRSPVRSDTNVMFSGSVMPKRDDAVEMSQKVAEEELSMRYPGSDFSHKNNGWEIIELNISDQFIKQLAMLESAEEEVSQCDSRMNLITRFQLGTIGRELVSRLYAV